MSQMTTAVGAKEGGGRHPNAPPYGQAISETRAFTPTCRTEARAGATSAVSVKAIGSILREVGVPGTDETAIAETKSTMQSKIMHRINYYLYRARRRGSMVRRPTMIVLREVASGWGERRQSCSTVPL